MSDSSNNHDEQKKKRASKAKEQAPVRKKAEGDRLKRMAEEVTAEFHQNYGNAEIAAALSGQEGTLET